MRFGLFASAEAGDGRGFADYVELCVEAEALGLSSAFLVEHHFTGWGQVSAPLMLQACVATRTTTIRLGTAVIVLPWHNPVLLAEQAATLDVLSDGRLDLGVGKGYRHSEFHGFGIPPADAPARFDEALAVMTTAWRSRERFSHVGRFWRFDDVVVEPAPVQQPHPPLWVAAASEASVRDVGRRGLNLLLDQFAAPHEIGERIAWYRAEASAAGQVAVARQAYIAVSQAEADEALARTAALAQRTIAVSRDPASDGGGSHVLRYRDATEAHAVYGTPDDVLERFAALGAHGVDYVLVVAAIDTREQLRRLSRHVIASELGREPVQPAARHRP